MTRASVILGLATVLTAGATADAATSTLDAYHVGEVRPPSTPEGLCSLLPLPRGQAIASTYDVVRGYGRGESRTIRIEGPSDGPRPTWRAVHAGIEIATHAETAGGLEQTILADLRREATFMFSPSMPVLPAGLVPAVPVEAGGSVVVLGKVETEGRLFVRPDDLQVRGRWSVVIEHDADVTLDVPAGAYDCKRIVTRTTLTFDDVDVEIVTTSYYAPGVGLVAAERRPKAVARQGAADERIRRLVLPTDSGHAIVLREEGSPEDG